MRIGVKYMLGVLIPAICASACSNHDDLVYPKDRGITVGTNPKLPGKYDDKYTVDIISGNNQTGRYDVVLPEPLRVRVLNAGGDQIKATIHFKPEGKISNLVVDPDGTYTLNWAPGRNSPTGYSLEPKLLMELRWIEGVEMNKIPVSFSANYKAEIVAGGNLGADAGNLNQPGGFCLDGSGNVYVADTRNNRIQKWAPGASSGITVAGGSEGGHGANELREPTGVYVDEAGNMYIADAGNRRIQKWALGATSGVTLGNLTTNSGDFTLSPINVFADASGTVYVLDKRGRVYRLQPGQTNWTIRMGYSYGSNPDQLKYPQGFFIQSDGTVFVADTDNHRVQKWLPGALSGITVAGGIANSMGNGTGPEQLRKPTGVFLDASGNMYVSEENGRTLKYYPGFTTWTTVGPFAAAIAGDAQGALYTLDQEKNRVIKWLP